MSTSKKELIVCGGVVLAAVIYLGNRPGEGHHGATSISDLLAISVQKIVPATMLATHGRNNTI